MLQLQQRGRGRTVWGGCSTVGSWVTFGTAVSPSGTDIRHKSLSWRSSQSKASSWAASWWVLSPCTPRASAPTADGGAQDRSPCLALLPEAPNPRGFAQQQGKSEPAWLLARTSRGFLSIHPNAKLCITFMGPREPSQPVPSPGWVQFSILISQMARQSAARR